MAPPPPRNPPPQPPPANQAVPAKASRGKEPLVRTSACFPLCAACRGQPRAVHSFPGARFEMGSVSFVTPEKSASRRHDFEESVPRDKKETRTKGPVLFFSRLPLIGLHHRLIRDYHHLEHAWATKPPTGSPLYGLPLRPSRRICNLPTCRPASSTMSERSAWRHAGESAPWIEAEESSEKDFDSLDHVRKSGARSGGRVDFCRGEVREETMRTM